MTTSPGAKTGQLGERNVQQEEAKSPDGNRESSSKPINALKIQTRSLLRLELNLARSSKRASYITTVERV